MKSRKSWFKTESAEPQAEATRSALEKEIADAKNKHNEFLKELGLPPLP